MRSAVTSTDDTTAGAADSLTINQPPARPRLSLPSDAVDMTISQRTTRDIPGSEGTVRIHPGDITEGQVLLAVLTSNGDELLNTASVRTGEAMHFRMDDQRYALHIKELRNLLFGDDFARLTIRLEPAGTDKVAEGKAAGNKAQDSGEKEAADTP